MDSSSDSKNKDDVSEDVTAQVENQDSGVEADDSLSADEIRTIALKKSIRLQDICRHVVL